MCGCDNQTYSNACVAAQKGISVRKEGSCKDQTQGCVSDINCSTDEECKSFLTCSNFNVEKRCVPKGRKVCPAVFQPVCGCDGITYNNACAAKLAGVDVKSQGKCHGEKKYSCEYNGKAYKEGEKFKAEDGCNTCSCKKGKVICTEKTCTPTQPKSCVSDINCPPDKVCRTTVTCSSQGTEKRCLPKGNATCPTVFLPVCGCDGKTYSNACRAKAAGVSLKAKGPCAPPQPVSDIYDDIKYSCEYNGKTYKSGDYFTAEDGCNTCLCATGKVTCSKKI
ncbi:MAG: Kazal-type serine protease inhibitor family protein, partial [Myxococcota bacterium]